MKRFQKYLFIIFITSISNSAFSLSSESCGDLFIDAISTLNTGGNILLDNNSNVYNSPDDTFAATSITAPLTACDSNPCSVTTTSLTPLVLPTFIYNSGGLDENYYAAGTFSYDGSTQNYGKLLSYSTGVFDFATSDTGKYYIETLATGHGGAVIFAPGDYYIENFSIAGNNTISVNGDGTVRLFIKNSYIASASTKINTPSLGTGDPSQFVMINYDSVDLSNSQWFTGYVYAAGDFIINNSTLYGAVSASNITSSNNVFMYYEDPADSFTNFGDLCSYPGQDLIAQFTFDELSGSDYSDSSGSGYTATASASSVHESSGKVCAAVEMPNDITSSFVGVETDVDSPSVVSKGSLAMWMNFNSDWDSKADRRTILYAKKAPRVFGIEVDKRGGLQLEFKDSSLNTFTAETNATSFVSGDWHHVVVTWDLTSSVDIDFYIDGVKWTTNVAASSEPWANFTSVSDYDEVYLFDRRAGDASPKDALDGLADEVNLYNYPVDIGEVKRLYNLTRSPCPTGVTVVDHFDYSFSASGSTCPAFPSAITIQAMDATNTIITGYEGTIDLITSSNHGTWSISNADGTLTDATLDDGVASYTFVTSDAGEIVLNLTNNHADITNFTATDSAQSVSTQSNNLTFADNVFLVEPETTQVAGKPLDVSVTLIHVDASNNQCGVATDYNQNNIKLWYEPTAIMASANAPQLNTTNLETSEPASADEVLNFTNGVANITLTSSDVGQFDLYVLDDVSGYVKDTDGSNLSLIGDASNIILRPFALEMDFDNDADVGSANSSNAFGSVFKKVDENFTLTVTPVLWQTSDDVDDDGSPDNGADLSNNSIIPSFDNSNEFIEIEVSNLLPAGGVTGSLSGTTTSDSYASNSHDYVLNYSEAGVIELSAKITGSGFLNNGLDAQNTLTNVGRFVPDHLAISANNVNLVDALNACNITYQGQDVTLNSGFVFTLNAQDSTGDPVLNYSGDFNKFDASSLVPSLIRTAATSGYGANPSVVWQAPIISDHTNYDGDWVVSVAADSVTYDKTNGTPTSNDLPYSAELNAHLSILQLTDSDNICVDTGSGCEAFQSTDITGATIIYGAVFLLNTYQSDLLDAQMPVELKIWATQNALTDFYTIATDSCTSFNLNDFEFLSCDEHSGSWCNATYQSNLATPHSWTGLSNGDGAVNVEAPGENNTGKLTIRLNLPDYLQIDYYGTGVTSPSATIDFGLSNKGGSLIFIEDDYR